MSSSEGRRSDAQPRQANLKIPFFHPGCSGFILSQAPKDLLPTNALGDTESISAVFAGSAISAESGKIAAIGRRIEPHAVRGEISALLDDETGRIKCDR